jgi:hypothetical protein
VEDGTGVCRVLLGRSEGKRSLGRPKSRWEVNIKIGLQGMRWEGMDWNDLRQDRDRWRAVVNAVMNL